MTSPALIALAALVGQSPSFHSTHPKLDASDCAGCHSAGPESDRTPPSGPGTHQRCDGADCHAEDFYEPETFAKTEVCAVCHTRKTLGIDPGFVSFPPSTPFFYAQISHRRHTDTKDVSLECSACHETKEERPGHSACVDCHQTSEPTMLQCAGCHEPRFDEEGNPKQIGPVGLPAACRVTKAFAGKHPVHLQQKLRGKKLTCEHCHPTVKKAKSLSELMLTQGRKTMMVSCGACHLEGGRSKVSLLGDCNSCHVEACFSAQRRVPAWHVPRGGPRK